ncbi:MAG: helix-turn-helix domain-containing protein, partial [Clostridia bacterium]|nr:helix-turn-helix domain-containing protein [Clostridia bacterium]
KAIRVDTLNKLCKALDCQPGDLFEYVPDPENAQAAEEA